MPTSDLAPPISVSVSHAGPAVVISLRGNADLAPADELGRQLDVATESQPPLVVLDLSHLDFLNSLTLRSFLELRRALARHGGQLRIASPTEQVANVFVQTRIDTIIPLHPTLDDALSA